MTTLQKRRETWPNRGAGSLKVAQIHRVTNLDQRKGLGTPAL